MPEKLSDIEVFIQSLIDEGKLDPVELASMLEKEKAKSPFQALQEENLGLKLQVAEVFEASVLSTMELQEENMLLKLNMAEMFEAGELSKLELQASIAEMFETLLV